ncbi:MAG TPA: hypothetical protein VE684_17400, partial [Crenalkalicoccus sp.]|nr:hypothetical protein [Crenalkalicoccus sp.]
HLRGGSVQVDGGSDVSADNFGTGAGGVLAVRGESGVTLRNAVLHAAARGRGAGATLEVTTGPGGAVLLDNAEASANSMGAGPGGAVRIAADSLTLVNAGAVRALALGAGRGGSIVVDLTGPLLVDGTGGGPGATQISASTVLNSSGDAGPVTVTAQDITVLNNGQIASSSVGRGVGGDISVTARGTITLSGLTGQRAIAGATLSGTGTGLTGIVALGARFGAGGPGRITVQSGNLTIGPFAGISATSQSGTTSSGGVVVRVDGRLLMDSTQFGTANIDLSARIAAASRVSATADAGSVLVEAGEITMLNNSSILSTTTGSGQGGSIRVISHGGLTMAAPAGGEAPAITARASQDSTGDAGNIVVQSAGPLTLSGSGTNIIASTAGTGNAGSVSLSAPQISVLQGASVASEVRSGGSGSGGTITIATPGALLVDGSGSNTSSRISTSAIGTTAGPAGSLTITAGSVTVQNDGAIIGRSNGIGGGGAVALNVAGDVLVQGAGSVIGSQANGSGDAGGITIAAQNLRITDGGAISTAARASNGGNIRIAARDLVYLRQGSLTTSVQGAQGTGGNIDLSARALILDGSQIQANAVGGNGGNILIATGLIIRSPDSSITASSQFGAPGAITFTGPQLNLNASLVVLAGQLRAAAALLRTSCAGRSAAPRSSLALG